jgi:hypothetical protein
MISLAASMARDLLAKQNPVGVAAIGQSGESKENEKDQLHLSSPRRENDYLWHLLRVLAPLEPGTTSLSSMLDEVRPMLSGRDQIIVITPSLSLDWMITLDEITHRKKGSRACQVVLLQSDESDKQTFEKTVRYLRQKAVATHLINVRDIKILHGAYGPLQRWEFKVTPTGRAIAVRTPRSGQPAGNLRL